MLKYTFSEKSSFLRTLKEEVGAYFIRENIRRSGGWRLLSKSIVQILSACGMYAVLVFFTPPPFFSVGFNLAVLGFNVMHEVAMGAFPINNV